jgi:hypothetical protein
MEPKPYDMKRPEDRVRWFQEMESYLRVSRFTEDGTDFKGRKFALDGFHQLRKLADEGKIAIKEETSLDQTTR